MVSAGTVNSAASSQFAPLWLASGKLQPQAQGLDLMSIPEHRAAISNVLVRQAGAPSRPPHHQPSTACRHVLLLQNPIKILGLLLSTTWRRLRSCLTHLASCAHLCNACAQATLAPAASTGAAPFGDAPLVQLVFFPLTNSSLYPGAPAAAPDVISAVLGVAISWEDVRARNTARCTLQHRAI